jgi:predicted dienelactone hydrolase
MSAVTTADEEWTDEARARTIPVRTYLPAPEESAEPCPAILFSHATGGARDGYAYLGRRWAERGYVSIHLQHRGSDVDVWRGKAGGALPALKRAAADPRNTVDRVLDVLFALDRLEAVDAASGSREAARVDLGRIGVAGHSFGAGTALAVAGQVFVTPEGEARTVADPRVKAVLAMSSPRPGGDERAFAAVQVPCLHFTGTRDDSPLNDTKASERRLPFDRLSASEGASDQILVTLAGGDHAVFTGSKRLFDDSPRDPVHHALVQRASLAFWDAYLRGDAASAEWLLGGGLAEAVGEDGAVEVKRGG